MTSQMRRLTMTCVLLGAATAALADDLEAAEKRIVEAWGKHKSMSAKIATTNHMEMGDMVMDGKGEGTLEMQREGDKQFIRMELKNAMTRKAGGQETKTDQAMTLIADGEFAYTSSDAMGKPVVVKSKIDPMMTSEPKALLAELRKQNDLKLLPEDKVDGQKVFVIEATPKEKKASPGAPAKMVLSFDQEHGVMVKSTALSEDGKPVNTMTYSDLKYDVKIDADRFKFKAPEGVQVIDSTGEKP